MRMNELTIGDKIYVSTKRAAEITGYAKDYVGQLCREGHVEAKMVGRSWYVLESSIREHRFGKEEGVATPEPVVEAPLEPEVSKPAAWEPPTYIPEPITTIPKIVPAPKAPETTRFHEEPALTEMQSAWREWFETRKVTREEVPEPEIEEEEEEVEIKRAPMEKKMIDMTIKEPEFAPQPVRQVAPRVEESARIVHERVVARAHAQSNGSNLIMIAFLIVIAGVAIAIAAVGTGYAADYLNENAIVRFLGGTSTVSK